MGEEEPGSEGMKERRKDVGEEKMGKELRLLTDGCKGGAEVQVCLCVCTQVCVHLCVSVLCWFFMYIAKKVVCSCVCVSVREHIISVY